MRDDICCYHGIRKRLWRLYNAWLSVCAVFEWKSCSKLAYMGILLEVSGSAIYNNTLFSYLYWFAWKVDKRMRSFYRCL